MLPFLCFHLPPALCTKAKFLMAGCFCGICHHLHHAHLNAFHGGQLSSSVEDMKAWPYVLLCPDCCWGRTLHEQDSNWVEYCIVAFYMIEELKRYWSRRWNSRSDLLKVPYLHESLEPLPAPEIIWYVGRLVGLNNTFVAWTFVSCPRD